MSTNAISQSTQQVIRNRSLTAGATIKVLAFFVRVIKFVAYMIEGWKFRLALRSYIPRPDDIIVVTYPRSGTTLVQMILYQLFTDGEMDFAHIWEWSPECEPHAVTGSSRIEHLSSPRVFKSHSEYKMIPKGPCKYIYSCTQW
jgi:hypothetical protein